MNRDFKGIWIPKEIWLNNDLKIMEKIFLVEIDSLDNEQGCFASNGYFAEFFGITKQRCSQIINSLLAKKYISIDYEKKGKEIVKRIIEVLSKFNRYQENLQGYQENLTGYQENAKGNNTINNTVNNIKKERKNFQKPTREEVREYLIEISSIMNLEDFFDHYDSNGWMVGRNKMKNWKATIRRWSRTYKEQNNPKDKTNEVEEYFKKREQAQT